MPGQTQRQPLLISSIIRHAARQHPQSEVVGSAGASRAYRTTYGAVDRRARQLLPALRRLGVLPGDRVATLALSSARHMELVYAVTGLGAVFQALDPSMSEDELADMLDQGDDCALFIDPEFADLAAALASRVRNAVRRLVVLCDEIELPMMYLPVAISLHCYEPLLAAEAPDREWPNFSDDVSAIIGVTAGTTGPRRMVMHSQRDIVLRALLANQPDGLGLRATDRVAACVEMHQSCGWMLPFVAPMTGCALLLAGWPDDRRGLADLLAGERATCVVAPPAALEGLARHLAMSSDAGASPPTDHGDANWSKALPSLRRVVVGGAVAAPGLQASLAGSGIEIQAGWGLTEADALITTTAPTAGTELASGIAAGLRAAGQGRAMFGVELKLTDIDGEELPWDGLAAGALHIRGPAVAQDYLDGDAAVDSHGWLPTGDVAQVGPEGYIRVLDRVSDLIRSGGTSISGRAVEATALEHPDVAEAACVAAKHPKWTERPVLLLVAVPGRPLDHASVQALLRRRLPRWSLPDALVTLPVLPRTPAGRVDKLALRRQYGDYLSRQSARA